VLILLVYDKVKVNFIKKSSYIIEKSVTYTVYDKHSLKSGMYLDLHYNNYSLDIKVEDSNQYKNSKNGDEITLDSNLYYDKKSDKLKLIEVKGFKTEFYN
uniref:hypothetical protein n=1 Tax=Paraclostridium bifermentans TaxID=1490 RepID=UPI00374F8075